MQGKDFATVVPKQGRYKSYFSNADIASLERISGKALAAMGYQTNFSDSDVSPSGVMLTLWTIKYIIYRATLEFHSKIINRKRKGFSQFAGRIKSAIQQMATNRRYG